MRRSRGKNSLLISNHQSILPLLPLRDMVVFPKMVVPLFVGRKKSVRALESAMESGEEVVLIAQRDSRESDPSGRGLYKVGVTGSIIQLLKLPDGTVKVLMEGQNRVQILGTRRGKDFLRAAVMRVNPEAPDSTQLEALIRSANTIFEDYVRLNSKIPSAVLDTIDQMKDPGELADYLAAHFNLRFEDRQELLETVSPSARLERLLGLMEREIEIFRVEKKIKTRVKRQMGRTQKEYYLNEQMKAIKRELGEREESDTDLRDIERRIKRKKLPQEPAQRIAGEFRKLKVMSPSSPEATVVRNYIDWLLSLPWDVCTEERVNIEEAEQILEQDHYGLRDVKERILEYLAVQRLVDKIKGPILCFVGPPGVGKTSLAQSIARATGRNFVRLSLGGVRDEAEIRGHRRTYVGSLPGKIIQHMKKAGSNNPVFLLDEVDKMSSDFRGDPAAALLEVLDPEQNHSFNDHYVDVDYDLSRVMFITTANSLQSIPPALQDRMEVIRIAGYTEPEKIRIAQGFLVVKQREAHGLSRRNLQLSDGATRKVIHLYTREAGVRNLERQIATLCRRVAKRVIKEGRRTQVRMSSRGVEKYLGVPRYRSGKKENDDQVGVVNGLAWTEAGGELLITEATVMPGKGDLIITGKLGDVMKESAQAALSYIRSRAKDLGLDRDFYQSVDVHVHLPEGGIPKDGPSAGITIATAITSALTQIPAKSTVAMTGEITLRGRIIGVGGLKQKILAAHRAGIGRVLIPQENEKNIEEIPPKILHAVRLIPVSHMDEVLRESLVFKHSNRSLKESDVGQGPVFAPSVRAVREAPTVRH